MNKSFTLTVMCAFACLALLVAYGPVSEDSDAAYASTFGSDSVGAEKIVFDSNGGSGGYAQYVLNGNSVYFPTEYKATGTSNSTYSQIAREGYALLGWSDDKNAADPTYCPGQSYTVVSDKTFYAVWKDLTYDCIERFGGSGNDLDCEAQHLTVSVGTTSGITVDDDNGAYILMRESISRGTLKYILTVTGNGNDISSTAGSTNTSISADWLTVNISKNGEFSFSGAPNRVGIYEVTLEMQTKGFSGSYGDLEDLYCKWFVSAYDSTDPSNIFHATYNGVDCGYGPFHTAVKLPDSVSTKQKGWDINVDGSNAIFPVGGSYSLVKKETVLSPNTYTYDEITATGIVGVVAYNANGGAYNGAFAELIPTEGYAGLKNGSIVSKEGYTFLGWNATGLSSDVIYPSGYLYDFEHDYTELKAVWGTSAASTKVYFNNPGDGSQNITINTANGFEYATPVNGFSLTGYDFIGWSETRYDVGSGTAEVGNAVTVSGTKTYYAVFEPNTYTCTIHYDGNGGTGSMPDQTVVVTSVPHYMTVNGCSFEYEGYSFAGWAETRYAESPSYSSGSSYCFTDSGEVTLYAVWAEKPPVVPEDPEPSNNFFYLIFNGNGASVTNVPPQVYRITSETDTSFYIPSTAPCRENYSFRGWSSTQYGSVEYEPGQKILVSLSDGEKSKTVQLFAVWELKTTGGDGTSVTVTFVADSGTLRSVSVPSGNAVTQITAPSVEGRAFIGWYTTEGKWDFSNPVTEDMTLTAKYLPIFHLEINGVSIKVVLDCTSSSTTVAFSDGFTKTYESSSIPAHTVGNNTSGSVTISVQTENGPYNAVCHYSVTDNQADSGQSDESEEDNEEKSNDLTLYYVAGGIVGIIALLAIIGRFLI